MFFKKKIFLNQLNNILSYPKRIIFEAPAFKSSTKCFLSLSDIKTLMKNCFNRDLKIKDISILNTGGFNTVYSISFRENCPQIVIKLAPPVDRRILTHEKKILRSEAIFLNLMNDTPIQTYFPQLLFEDYSKDFINRDFIITSKMPGIPWYEVKNQLSLKQTQALQYRVGQIAQKISHLKGEFFGSLSINNSSSHKSWLSSFQNMWGEILEDANYFKAKLPTNLSKFWEIFDKVKYVFKKVKTPRLVHKDLSIGNIFLSKCGLNYDVIGIVDCERSLYGDPFLDSIFAQMNLENTYLRGFLGLDKNKISFDQKIRRKMYSIYSGLIMVIQKYSRVYQWDYILLKKRYEIRLARLIKEINCII